MENHYEKINGLQPHLESRYISCLSFKACKLSTFKFVLISAKWQLPNFENSKLTYFPLCLFSLLISSFQNEKEGTGKESITNQTEFALSWLSP